MSNIVHYDQHHGDVERGAMFNVSEDVCRICSVHWNTDIFNLSTNFRNEGGGASSGILPHLGQIMQYQNSNPAEKYFVVCMCWPLTLLVCCPVLSREGAGSVFGVSN